MGGGCGGLRGSGFHVPECAGLVWGGSVEGQVRVGRVGSLPLNAMQTGPLLKPIEPHRDAVCRILRRHLSQAQAQPTAPDGPPLLPGRHHTGRQLQPAVRGGQLHTGEREEEEEEEEEEGGAGCSSPFPAVRGW